MCSRSLAEVGARLGKAFQLLPDEPADASEAFELYLQLSIAILDSEHSDFRPGLLQEHLKQNFIYFNLSTRFCLRSIRARSDSPPAAPSGAARPLLHYHFDQILEVDMTDAPTVTRKLIEGEDRMLVVERRFGIHWPFMLEGLIFQLAAKMTRDVYQGGCWNFYELSNGGFYIAPNDGEVYNVVSDNFFEGKLTADALGIVCCLYAYSHLSFSRDERFGRICADHYHRLREYMFGHTKVASILRAID